MTEIPVPPVNPIMEILSPTPSVEESAVRLMKLAAPVVLAEVRLTKLPTKPDAVPD